MYMHNFECKVVCIKGYPPDAVKIQNFYSRTDVIAIVDSRWPIEFPYNTLARHIGLGRPHNNWSCPYTTFNMCWIVNINVF